MSDYVLSCESTVDLTPEKIQELGLECIFFHFYIDGVEYADDLGQTIPFDKFYQAMKDGAETKTAAIGTGEYEKFFRGFFEQGKDVLHVSLSSGISGTVESARIAAESLAGRVSRSQDLHHRLPCRVEWLWLTYAGAFRETSPKA